MYKFDQKGLRSKVNIDNDPQRRPWKNQLGQEKTRDKSFLAFISGRAHYNSRFPKPLSDWIGLTELSGTMRQWGRGVRGGCTLK